MKNRKKAFYAALAVVGLVLAGLFVQGSAANAGGGLGRQVVEQKNIAPHAVSWNKIKPGAVNETRLSGAVKEKLNAVGTGEQGPKGDKGDPGDQGPKGDPGLTELESDGPYPGATELQDGDNSTAKWVGDEGATLQKSWVMCPEGKTAIGGGYSRADEGPAAFRGLQVVTSQPAQVVNGDPTAYSPIEGDPDGSYVPNGWLVEGFNNGTTDLIVRPHVVCAVVAN